MQRAWEAKLELAAVFLRIRGRGNLLAFFVLRGNPEPPRLFGGGADLADGLDLRHATGEVREYDHKTTVRVSDRMKGV
jgi:hypothetical protein